MNYDFYVKRFDELTVDELHDLLALRIDVFVVEQNCPYPELDGKDKKAYHVIGTNAEGKVIATARILPSGISYDEVSIGRVASDFSFRGKGLGHQLMTCSMEYIKSRLGDGPVRISAQEHLEDFYGKHHFVSTGKKYLEDGIPHIEMITNNKL